MHRESNDCKSLRRLERHLDHGKQRLICYHRLSGVKLALLNPGNKWRRWPAIVFVHLFLSLSTIFFLLSDARVFARTPPAPAQSNPAQIDPAAVVRKAVQNELKASGTDHFMFRCVKTTAKGSTTKIYVETKDATAGMVIANDGKALTSGQRQEEEARLERFVSNPEELRKKRAQEHEDAERSSRIMRAMPDAFLFAYAGEERGTPGIGRLGDPLVKMTFRPNPNYQPPSHVEEVLTGMQGEVLVDAVHYRIASIDGTLFKSVGFGWGILGRLNAGGHFIVHQEDVADNSWEISSMTVNFTGKILLVKNLLIQSTEVFSGFKRVSSDLSFAQGIELLKKEESARAENVSDGARAAKP